MCGAILVNSCYYIHQRMRAIAENPIVVSAMCVLRVPWLSKDHLGIFHTAQFLDIFRHVWMAFGQSFKHSNVESGIPYLRSHLHGG